MKLAQLKEAAYRSWDAWNLIDGTELSAQPFTTEMRHYGDLRRKATWEQACIDLESKWLVHGLDNTDLIRYFQQPDTPIGKAFNNQVLDAVLTHASALEQLKNGLETLYNSPISADDRSIAVQFLKRISGHEYLAENTSLQTHSLQLVLQAA